MPNDLKRAQVRLYRIFNMRRDERGTPFAMCDFCYRAWRDKGYPQGQELIVEKIADGSLVTCQDCGVSNVH